jgi:thioredoxin-like negative regulator of GroEL
MAPIVHGLEKQYRGRIDFLYLDVEDPRTAAAKARLGYQATPHFFTLTAEGRLVEKWQGVAEAGVVEGRLQQLVGEAGDGSTAPR